jgi:putative ABC transport system permease protein
MHRWLEKYAYRIDLSLSFFVLAAVTAFLVALFTVSFQAIKAAYKDPVKALRYE